MIYIFQQHQKIKKTQLKNVCKNQILINMKTYSGKKINNMEELDQEITNLMVAANESANKILDYYKMVYELHPQTSWEIGYIWVNDFFGNVGLSFEAFHTAFYSRVPFFRRPRYFCVSHQSGLLHRFLDQSCRSVFFLPDSVFFLCPSMPWIHIRR